MPLDPQVRAVLDIRAAAGLPPTHTMSVAEARAAVLARHAAAPPWAEAVAAVDERCIPGPAGDLRIRIYRPWAPPPLPVLVFMHGGGWTLGDLDTADGLCRALSNAGGCMVVSVDYRRAPEHRFPAALDDADAAAMWVVDNAEALDAGASRVAVGGESAGGNLAAALCLRARGRGHPALAAQLLLCAPLDHRFDTQSYVENADGYLLTRADMQWFWSNYLPDPTAGEDPLASPLRAPDLHGLPPALVVTAEFDPLRDEGDAYATRLAAAEIPVILRRYPGMVHGFPGMAATVDAAAAAIAEIGTGLRSLIDQPQPLTSADPAAR